jgi:hypothetical protein
VNDDDVGDSDFSDDTCVVESLEYMRIISLCEILIYRGCTQSRNWPHS